MNSADGLLTVSHSELATWTRCPRRWFLGTYLSWGYDPATAPVTGNAQLGNRIHLALEASEGHGLDALQVLEYIYDTEIAGHPYSESELRKEADLAFAMLEGFLQWAEEEGYNAGYAVIGTERETSIVLPFMRDSTREFRLIAKLDVLVRRLDDGAVLFRDYKPQPLTENVLTPSGWTKLGDLTAGDLVCGAHGEPVVVRDIFDRGVDQVYRITFSDNTSVRATADHPWLARPAGNLKLRVMQTSQLKKNTRLVPYTPRENTPGADLPMEPYLLGAWLSNGDRRGRNVTDGEQGPLAAAGLPVKEVLRDGRVLFQGKLNREHRSILENLGLLMLYSGERFIPSSYLHGSSFTQRLALLQGLMDGDGSHEHSVVYHTVSSSLAEGVAELVRSLGGWAKVWVNPKLTYTGSTDIRVVIRTEFNPFRACGKALAWQQRKEEVQKKAGGERGKHGSPVITKIVRSVEPDGEEQVRCIQLDSDEHLYVTSGYAVTHNTVATFEKANRLPRDTQMKTYSLIQAMQAKEDPSLPRAAGGQYVMLRRTKRTPKAKPPFYKTEEFSYNQHDLNSTWIRVRQIATEIRDARSALDTGADHHAVARYVPGEDCDWACPFSQVCPMFDDGSRAEDALAGNFTQVDPYARYRDTAMDRILEHFRSGRKE